MAIRAVLFDKDGTILDFARTWGPATLKVLDDLAAGDAARKSALIDVAAIDPHSAVFAPHSPIIAGSSADYGVPFADIIGRTATQDFFTEMDLLFARHGLDSLCPLPGAVEAILALGATGMPMGLVTNDSEAAAREQMVQLGLDNYLSFIAGYDSGFGAKPHPGMIIAYIDRSGFRPSEIAVIGDSLHDLHAARAAGALGIAVTTGLASHADLAEAADLIALDLPSALKSLGL
ncbi:MAG: HAD family hydrolase [Hyphomicrobiales bacterium]|nr:HAD family hydrolase [Hyphomicrobiales bacterium]